MQMSLLPGKQITESFVETVGILIRIQILLLSENNNKLLINDNFGVYCKCKEVMIMTLEKTLKLAGSFLKIARVFVIAIGIIVLFSILVVKGSNSIVVSETTASVILGNLKVTLNQPQLAQQILNSNSFPFAILIVASFCIIFYLGLRELGKIVEEALQSSVFGKNISKRLIHLAWYVIVGGMINILSVIVSALRINSINLMQIFNTSVVTGIDIKYTYDISFIFITFVLYLLAKIFEYGAELQKLSDETL